MKKQYYDFILYDIKTGKEVAHIHNVFYENINDLINKYYENGKLADYIRQYYSYKVIKSI